jgi:hypothetical protein
LTGTGFIVFYACRLLKLHFILPAAQALLSMPQASQALLSYAASFSKSPSGIGFAK